MKKQVITVKKWKEMEKEFKSEVDMKAAVNRFTDPIYPSNLYQFPNSEIVDKMNLDPVFPMVVDLSEEIKKE